MNLFILADGRRTFYQWDTNRQLIVIEPICAEVHFDNGTKDFSLVREVKIDKGLRVVDVPDILLQSTKSINVFAYVCDGEGGYTRRSVVFPVMARPKPADYPYAGEDELRVWEEHEKKIEAAQAAADAAASAASKAQETADGAIQAPAVAEAGQTIRASKVNNGGKPIEWEAVDFPSRVPESVEFTTVSAGTIPAGDNSTAIDTGVSWADLKDFDLFEVCVGAGSGNSSNKCSFSFYNRATPPEVWRRFQICSNLGKIRFKKLANGVYEMFMASGTVAASAAATKAEQYIEYYNAMGGPSTQLAGIKWADTDKIYIYKSATTTIEQTFTIAGIKFK